MKRELIYFCLLASVSTNALANLSGPTYYIKPSGTVLFVDGKGGYCGFVSTDHFEEHAMMTREEPPNAAWDEVYRHKINPLDLLGLVDLGICKTPLRQGFYDWPGSPGIFYTSGSVVRADSVGTYCHVTAPQFVTGEVKNYDYSANSFTTFEDRGNCE